MILLPTVELKSSGGAFQQDIMSRLLAERIIWLDEPISDDTASAVVTQMLYLESQSPHDDIMLYINTQGGMVSSGNSIIDFMDYCKCDICTIAHGRVASMGAVILSNGAKGKRLAMPRANIMIHQVKSGVPYGQASDILINAENIEQTNNDLIALLARNCGKSFDEMYQAVDRDNFMNARQAVEFGIVDAVI